MPDSRVFTHPRTVLAGTVLGALLLSAVAQAGSGAGTLRIVSAGPEGLPAVRGASASSPSASDDGRFVCFTSDAIDYAPCLTDSTNIFVKDRQSGYVELISRSTAGAPANGYASRGVISGDGRFVAFTSGATNLGGPKDVRRTQVYVRDRVLGTTERLPLPTDAQKEPSSEYLSHLRISRDGRYVLYSLFASFERPEGLLRTWSVMLFDREARSLEPANRYSTGHLIRESAGDQGIAMTPNGSHIAFTTHYFSSVGTLGAVWVWDRVQGVRKQVSGLGSRPYRDPSFSVDGRFLLLRRYISGDDVVVCDLVTGAVERYPELADAYAAVLSPDGRTILLEFANGVAWYDRESRQMTVGPGILSGVTSPSTANDAEGEVSTSAVWAGDGSEAVFASGSPNLVPGDTNGRLDVFVARRTPPAVERVSVHPGGRDAVACADSTSPVQTPDGRYIVFRSDARDLVTDPVNTAIQLYIKDRTTGDVERVSVSPGGDPADRDVLEDPASITPDGRFVLFFSRATNLVAGSPEFTHGPYLRDRSEGTTTHLVLPGGYSGNVVLGADGRTLAYVNGSGAYVYDRISGVAERVSLNAAHQPMHAVRSGLAMSADARFVYFRTRPNVRGNVDPDHLFIRDRLRRRTTRLFSGQLSFDEFSCSPDGRYLVFTTVGRSYDDTSIVLYDLQKRRQERVSLNPAATRLRGCRNGAVSPEGRFVAFQASLPRSKSGSATDAYFLLDRVLRTTSLVSRKPDGSPSDLWTSFRQRPSVSQEARHLLFSGSARDLLEFPTLGGQQIYSLDRM